MTPAHKAAPGGLLKGLACEFVAAPGAVVGATRPLAHSAAIGIKGPWMVGAVFADAAWIHNLHVSL